MVRWQLADENKARVTPWTSGEQKNAGSGGDPRGVGSSGHAKLIANFMAALRGEAELVIDGREGRRGLRVILDIYEKAGLI